MGHSGALSGGLSSVNRGLAGLSGANQGLAGLSGANRARQC